MPSLDDVTQRFIADTAPYIAGVKAAADAAEDFIRKNAEVIASMKAVGEAAADSASGAATLAGVERELRDASADLMMQTALLASMDERLAAIQRDAADSSADLMMQTQLLRSAMSEENGTIDDLIAHLIALNAAQDKAAGGAVTASRRFLLGWGLTGNAIHWIISGLAEYLAVALPGTIAAAAGAFVLYQGVVEQVSYRMIALYGATEATAAMIGKTTGDVLGLGHAFQTAQDAANPIAYQLLGAYINGAKSNMTNFASAGLEVARMLDELSAKIDVDLRQGASEFQGLIANMVSDLQEFGQILGNLGHALLNFASDMPGLAELLLKIADAISRVILWLSELPRWLILGVMAFEELNRWGGLLITIFGKLGLASGDLAKGILSPARAAGIFRGILGVFPALLTRIGGGLAAAGAEMGFFGADVYAAGVAMEDAGKAGTELVATISGGVALAFIAGAVGIGIMIDKLITATTYAQRFSDNLEKGIASSSNMNALATIADSIGKVNTQMSQTPHYTQQVVEAAGKLAPGFQAANQQVQQLTASQQKMMDQGAQLVEGAGKISGAFGTTFAQSLALADVAGVKLATTTITLGKNANVAGMQIENLVTGYKAMDQTGGILGTDMNALAIQSGLADTKVSGLNSALDQFQQNSASLTSGLASLNQDISELGNNGVEAGKKFSVFSGTTVSSVAATAKSLESFSGTGAQTWQNYDAALQQAQQFTDSLRTAAAYGAIGQRQFTGSIADTVKSLLPYTAHSKTAVSELSAIAQEAGGPATDSYKQLKKWVDENDISNKELNKTLQTTTASLSNAGAAAQEFASTLQSEMQEQIAQSVLKGSNLNKIVAAFQQSVLHAAGQVSSSSPQYIALEKYFEAAGLTAQQARNEIKELQSAIDATHGKTIEVNVETNYSSTGHSSGGGGAYVPGSTGALGRAGQHGMTVGFAGGGMVGGQGGVDAIHAMLTAGEAVLTAAAVASLGGPLAIHSLNTQPSQAVLGGGGGGGGGSLTLNLHTTTRLDSQKVAEDQRTNVLTYNRRNPRNNLSLRAR